MTLETQIEKCIDEYSNYFKKKIKQEGATIKSMDEWVLERISERLGNNYKNTKILFKEYSLEEGVMFYIEYLNNFKGNNPKPIKNFFRKFNLLTKTFVPGVQRRKLSLFYDRWNKIKSKKMNNSKEEKGKIKFKEAITFEDWINSQISSELSKKLDFLITHHFGEYTLQEGATLYIEYLSNYEGNNPRSIQTFFQKFNPVTKTFLPIKGKMGKLNKYMSQWRQKIKSKEKITFEDWINQQIPTNIYQKLGSLITQHFTEYSLEQCVEFYIEYLINSQGEKLKSITNFFRNFNPITKTFLPRNRGTSKIYKHYHYWIMEGKILEKSRPKEYLEFEDWIKSKISQDISDKFEQTIYQSFILPLVQGIEFYIEHLSSFEGKKPKKITTFFRRFNTDTKTFLPKGKRGKLHIFYGYWDYNIKNKNITFTDYLISKLPEEQRQRATYYLKGLYLVDQIKESADFNKIKSAL